MIEKLPESVARTNYMLLRYVSQCITPEQYAITASEMLNIALKLGRGLQARGVETRHRAASRRRGLSKDLSEDLWLDSATS